MLLDLYLVLKGIYTRENVVALYTHHQYLLPAYSTQPICLNPHVNFQRGSGFMWFPGNANLRGKEGAIAYMTVRRGVIGLDNTTFEPLMVVWAVKETTKTAANGDADDHSISSLHLALSPTVSSGPLDRSLS